MQKVIHMSIFSELFPDKKKPCFPSEGKVETENGKTVTISELQIGDKVKAGI